MKKFIRLLKMTSFLFFLCFLSLRVFAWTDSERGNFESANKAYRDGKYDQAVQSYQEILKSHPHSGVLYLNLGNAFFRNQQIGDAILAYERGLKFDPRNEDIRYNLNYVRSRLEYSIKDTRNWYIKAVEKVLNYFSIHETVFVCLLTYALLMLGWWIALNFRRDLPWGWLRKTYLVLFLTALVFAGLKNVQAHIIRDAIVTEKEAEVRFGPSSSDQVAFRLGQGLKVYVVDHQTDWSRLLLANGESGWVRNSQISEVIKE